MDECRGEPRGEAAQDRKPVIDAADEPIAGSEKDEIGGNGFGAGEAGGAKPVVAAFCATAIKAITAKSRRQWQDARQHVAALRCQMISAVTTPPMRPFQRTSIPRPLGEAPLPLRPAVGAELTGRTGAATVAPIVPFASLA